MLLISVFKAVCQTINNMFATQFNTLYKFLTYGQIAQQIWKVFGNVIIQYKIKKNWERIQNILFFLTCIQSESDWDLLSDEETIVPVRSKELVEEDENQVVDPSISAITVDASTFCIEEEPDPQESGINWLTRNVTVQYWCGQSRAEDIDSTENLKKDW